MGSHSRNYSRQESHDEETEEICVSTLSCHLQKTWQSLSSLSQSCFGRRGHVQKLYCWYPDLVLLRGMIHQTMNSPERRASNQSFLLCFVNVCICLLTPMLSYQGLSGDEQCLNIWRNQIQFSSLCPVLCPSLLFTNIAPNKTNCFQSSASLFAPREPYL